MSLMIDFDKAIQVQYTLLGIMLSWIGYTGVQSPGHHVPKLLYVLLIILVITTIATHIGKRLSKK